MEMEKMEMDGAIQNGTLRQWVETQSEANNFTNYNVWYYYSLNDEAPDAYGPQPTQEQLQECKELGIRPGKCSDTEILSHKCLGPVVTEKGVNPCNPSDEPPITLDTPLAILFAAAGAAAVVGIVIALRLSRQNTHDQLSI